MYKCPKCNTEHTNVSRLLDLQHNMRRLVPLCIGCFHADFDNMNTPDVEGDHMEMKVTIHSATKAQFETAQRITKILYDHLMGHVAVDFDMNCDKADVIKIVLFKSREEAQEYATRQV